MPDTTILAEPVTVTKAACYVVVSHWHSKDGKVTDTEYERFDHLNDAIDSFVEYENGEYARARPAGIFPGDANGMPIDKPLQPHALAQLVRETRAA